MAPVPKDAEPTSDLPLDVITHEVEEHVGPSKARRRRWIFVPMLVVAFFAGGVAGLYFQPPGVQAFFRATGLQPGDGSAAPIALPADVVLPDEVIETLVASDVVGLARLLPAGDTSIVAPPFGAGDARVAEIHVAVGDHVGAGQVLAVLDSLPSLETTRLSAEADVVLQEALLAQTRETVRLSTLEAEATLAEARATAAAADASLERTRDLVGRGVVTQATLDEVEATASQAQESVNRALASLARYGSTPLDEQPDVIVAQRGVEAARIQLSRAEEDLSRAFVTAPIAGVVLSIDARLGHSAAGGLMEIGNIDQMMAEVEVYQDRVQDVEVGQPVELISGALDRILTGQVNSIGLQVRRQENVSADTAANVDARVVEVMVVLDDSSSALARRFTNLEAVARIDSRPEGVSDAPPQ